MQRKVILYLSIILLSACKETAPVSKDKMVAVMSDVMLMESGNLVKYTYGAVPDSIWHRDYAFVAKKHGLSEEKLKAAIEYYSSRPEAFSAIMEKVITGLQKEQVKLQNNSK